MDPTEQAGTTDPKTNQGGTVTDDASAKPNTEPARDAGNVEGKGDGAKPATAGDTASTEAKPDGKGNATDAKADDVPAAIEYADFSLPEGITLEGERKEQVVGLFQSLKLDQSQGQGLIDWFAANEGERVKSVEAAVESAIMAKREEWAQQSATLFGEHQARELGYAKTAVLAVKDPELEKAWDELGWGNHPALLKAFATFGRMMREAPMDGIGSHGHGRGQIPIEERVYPNMNGAKR